MFQKKEVPVEVILGSRVVVNTSIRTEKQGGGLLVVVPRKKTRAMKVLSFFFFIPREQKLFLDELGLEVFENCRREMAVSGIVDSFREKHNVSEEYGRRSVIRYLDALARKGVIGFLVEPDKSGGDAKQGGKGENVRG